MRTWKKKSAGNALVEFTLVGIPLIFVLISTVEMARGMWIFHTMAHAVKEGARFAAVRGASCSKEPNTCAVPLSAIAQRIRQSGVGLVPADMNVTFTAGNGATTSCKLSDCLGSAAMWPPAGGNTPGMNVEVAASYRFQSVICMFWPGSEAVGPFAAVNLPARSRERIHF
jgi:Flp pilus assembly protein TadG